MTMTIRPMIAGNWKMNGLAASLDEAKQLAAALAESPTACDVALCPPATLLAQMAWVLKGSAILIGAQDCHGKDSGAYTGDIAALMLADSGASLVILGHSERRTHHGETDAEVAAKVEAALRAGLKPIICVGETLEHRQAGQTLQVLTSQIAGSVPASLADAAFAVAYEPCWAIGTGLTPTLDQIAQAHAAIRAALPGQGGAVAPILYGGSVKPDNAGDILKIAQVGGALVGGASLKASDFLGIIRAL
ncbi:MAG: triose-phosphate isomerase [Alphaproteobacteria bacterium]